MTQVQGAALLYVAHHPLPLGQVLLHHPVDQPVDLVLDALRHICHDLLLELCAHHVAPHQVLDIGQPQGAVKEVQAALFQAVKDVLHLGDARGQFGVQVPLVFPDGGLESLGGLPVLLHPFGLCPVFLPGLANQLFRHAQRIGQL